MPSVVNYTFPDHHAGDTFPGLRFTININSTPANLTGAAISMIITGKSNLTLSTANNTIAITGAATGQFEVSKQVINLTRGQYQYVIRITFANGDIKSYIKGIWRII